MRNRILYWSPRVLGILSILFVSVFALDVFESGVPLSAIAVGLFMHLLPSFFLAGLLALAWKFELVGGAAFVMIALLPFFMLENSLSVNAILSAPFLATGILFLIDGFVHRPLIPTENQ